MKWSRNSVVDKELLRDCDLGSKINAHSATSSGGQSLRKLQLVIRLLGGSKGVF
jgi:hypothetical protein